MGLLMEVKQYPPTNCQCCGSQMIRRTEGHFLCPDDFLAYCQECGAEQERWFTRYEGFEGA